MKMLRTRDIRMQYKQKDFNKIYINHNTVRYYFLLLFIFGLFTKCYASQALEFDLEPSDVIVPETNSVLLECAGHTEPSALKEGKTAPNIRWRGPDGQDIGIVGDTFRTQLPNGSLYVSSVEENRGLTGAYQCLLTVDGLGTIVSRSARVSIARLPETNQDSNEIYLFPGQTAYFNCLSNPIQKGVKYQIQWLKDESPIRLDQTRMSILPSGALEIDELTASDRGTYQCNLTSGSFTSLSSKSNLNIKSTAGTPESFAAPSFLAKPRTQIVREGDTITLDCVSNGNPKPSVRWLKNGEDIDMNDLDSRFRIIGTGTLQISGIEDGDSGNYQCRASNTEDSLDEAATVQVQVPPKFIQSPNDKNAYEKEELELSCSIHGKPTPTISWLKNGDLITPNDYMQIVGGHNLRILGLINADAGMFQCIGTNQAGSVQASARLQILEPDYGPSKKRKQMKKEKLSSSSSASLMKNTNFNKKIVSNSNYYLNREIQDDESSIKNNDKQDQEQTNKMLSKSVLDSLRSKDKKKISQSSSTATQLLSSFGDGFNLNVDEDDEDDEDDDYNGEEDSEDDEDNPKKTNSNNNNNNNSDSRKSSKHDEILHFSHFPFPTITRKYPPDLDGVGSGGIMVAPIPGPPRDLVAQIIKPRFVALSWMEPSVHPDEVISYTVYYKMSTSERERKITTKSRDDQQINIQALLPGKSYQFRIVGNSNHGPGESSKALIVATQPEENIAGPPQNVEGYAVSHNEIYIKWKAPIISNGVIAKYRIYYAEDDGSERFVDSTKLETNLTELRPYTEYTISVVPFNQNGMGDTSNEIHIKTFSSTPSETPYNVTLEATSSTSITIRWEPPPEEDRNGQITGYKIRYRKMKKGSLQVETTPGNVRHYELKALDRISQYQVKIAALTVNGSGPFTEWQHIETYENDLDESQVPGAPGWIRTRPSSESIGVSWGPPTQQEIKVRGFILGWGKGIPDEDTQPIDENKRDFEIIGLEPNSEYVISLRARNAMGDGPPVYDYVRTREESPVESPAPLEVPVGLRAITMSAASIVVYWTDTTLNKNQHVTDNRFYVVKYSTAESSRFRYHNTTDLNCMIGDLKPNTQYEFAVKVVKGRRESAWSMSVLNITMHASPITPPRGLVVRPDDNNQQNVVLQWQPPKHSNGPITGSVVFYTTDTTKHDRDWNVEALVGDKHVALIRNLKPHTTYYFKVQTRNAKGYGPFSAMISHKTGQDLSKTEATPTTSGISSQLMITAIIGGCVGVTIITILSIIFIFCRRKPQETPEHNKKSSYQKHNAGIIKPPDLWIHHDQMELKNMDKSHHSTNTPGCSDGASSSGAMTLPRSVVHDFDASDPANLSHVTNSLDKRTYVPGYITTPINASMERPQYPRTQYNMQQQRAHVSVDPALSQQSLAQPVQGSSLAQTPENPYAYDIMPSNYSNPAVTYAPGLSVDAPKRGQGHPLKSFSVPAPPATTPIINSQGKHVPAVTIRPQNSSPYKKQQQQQTPLSGTNTLTNRLQSGPQVQHSTDEIQRLAPSTSTEELNQEMANLEGLMKDLSAITANEFEC